MKNVGKKKSKGFKISTNPKGKASKSEKKVRFSPFVL